MLPIKISPAKNRQYRLRKLSQQRAIREMGSAKKETGANIFEIISYSQSKHLATEPFQACRSSISLRTQNTKRPSIVPSICLQKNNPCSYRSKTISSEQNLAITAKCWSLFDSKRMKNFGFRKQYRREIASLTKIMTTILAIELIQEYSLSQNLLVRITKNSIANVGTSAELRQNQWIRLEDLLYGVMLPSGNDAAHCLAEYLGYILKQVSSQREVTRNKYIDLTKVNTASYLQEFISKMNERAFALGLYNTRFSNPHGLQNALNTSSAEDVLHLSIHASKNPLFRRIMNTYCYKYEVYKKVQSSSGMKGKWWNTNKLLLKGWEGIKTGHTTAAGSCLSSLKDNIYVVVLNSQDIQARFSDVEKIYELYQKKLEKGGSSECGAFFQIKINKNDVFL